MREIMPFLRPEEPPDQPPGQPEYYPTYWREPGKQDAPEILLRQVSPNTFQLVWGFRYQPLGSAASYSVTRHDLSDDPKTPNNSTDLASVPPLLWWFIASYGLHTKAALFHDHFVDAPPPGKTRKDVDTLFRDALRESEVRWLRRWLMWTAVSLRTRFRAFGLGVIFLHLIVLIGLTIYWAVGGAWWPALVAALVGFVWGLRRWPLAVIGFVLVALPAILAYLARLFVLITEYIEEVIVSVHPKRQTDPRPFKRPQFRPYQNEPGPF